MNKEKTIFKAKSPKAVISFLVALFVLVSYHTALAQQSEKMVRISEIEIDPAFLEEYKAILAEESAASVKLEPGVIAIFPMYQKENPTSVRILEMYASKTAYEQHLKTPHFLKYKTTTLKMVKSLKLVDMGVIDEATMPLLFRKIKEDK
ncbi:MAG: antibiotic biosynthesis monooxygenase [Chitinophagaceae bacterium]|nr:MAG: antibiotic biosynthesis monooxygenase [Chitinophagaceae bacterium]